MENSDPRRLPLVTLLRQWREEDATEVISQDGPPRLLLLIAGLCLIAGLTGLLIGTFWLGPLWYASWHCLRGVPIPMPPHQFAVCALP